MTGRKVPIEHVVERDGRWYCTVADCPRATVPFDDARSAKSHPWPAHRLRSRDPKSVARTRRRKLGEVPRAIRDAIDYTDTESSGWRRRMVLEPRVGRPGAAVIDSARLAAT